MGPEDIKDGVILQLYAPFSALYDVGCSSPCPGNFTPRKGTGTHFTEKRVGSKSCRDGCVEEKNLLSPPDFESRAVQFTDHLYTDYAVPALHTINKLLFENER